MLYSWLVTKKKKTRNKKIVCSAKYLLMHLVTIECHSITYACNIWRKPENILLKKSFVECIATKQYWCAMLQLTEIPV